MLKGKPMVIHTAERCVEALGTENVFVATDDHRIHEVCSVYNINSIDTPRDCLTGTDRVAACLKYLNDADCIVNVQGDEPLVLTENIFSIIDDFFKFKVPTTGYAKILNKEDFFNPNIVKFATSNEYLIYASRAGIPSSKTQEFYNGYCHVPIYAFSVEDLKKFSKKGKTGKTYLEKLEDIEILRLIELGIPVKTSYIKEYRPAVDIKADIKKVLKYLE